MVLAVAAAVRIRGAWNDLWLDEIWSLYLARDVSSPVEIFTKIHHSNNHYLNTLYCYLVGPRGDWPGYRIPSLLAGVGAVALAGLIGRRRNSASGLLAMLLTGSSYVLILYSSEARGYAAAVFFSFLSFYVLDRYLETRRWPLAMMFSLSTVLGLLSQLVFFGFYAAALVWSGYRLMRSRLGPKQIMMAAISCHAVPIFFFAVLYVVDFRYTAIKGGTPSTPLGVYTTALAWALGTPTSRTAVLATCTAAVALLIVGLWMLWREKSDLFVFFTGAIPVFPVLLAVVSGSDVFYVRFFIIGIAFFLILLSFVLADLYQRSSLGKAICVLLLLGFFAANGWHVASLFQYGRGHYCDAIRFLKEQSKQRPESMASNSDLRVGLMLTFYGPPLLAQAKYYTERSVPRQGSEWIIYSEESFEAPVPPVNAFKDRAGNRYEFREGVSWPPRCLACIGSSITTGPCESTSFGKLDGHLLRSAADPCPAGMLGVHLDGHARQLADGCGNDRLCHPDACPIAGCGLAGR